MRRPPGKETDRKNSRAAAAPVVVHSSIFPKVDEDHEAHPSSKREESKHIFFCISIYIYIYHRPREEPGNTCVHIPIA
jgi:hypothetical protein